MTELAHPDLKINHFVEKYNLVNFVETGCFYGFGLQHAVNCGIKNLYSCDIGENFVDYCKERFPNANLICCDSVTYFKNILSNVSGATLFWLDAHYPAYYGFKNLENEQTKFPLYDELKLIIDLKKDFKNDVIICDDLRVLAPIKNPYYNGHLEKYFLVDYTLENLVSMMINTHNFYTVNGDTGNIIFVPK